MFSLSRPLVFVDYKIMVINKYISFIGNLLSFIEFLVFLKDDLWCSIFFINIMPGKDNLFIGVKCIVIMLPCLILHYFSFKHIFTSKYYMVDSVIFMSY